MIFLKNKVLRSMFFFSQAANGLAIGSWFLSQTGQFFFSLSISCYRGEILFFIHFLIQTEGTI